jgi:predicted GNAT family N-acyltransferase
MLSIRICKTEEVFQKGQNISKDADFDGLDDIAEHVICYLDNEVVGTIRIRYLHNDMKLERLAVLASARGKSIGKEIMLFTINYFKTKPELKGILLSAQQYLEKFYNNLGFTTLGEPYTEVGIPHVKMYIKK